jgi:nucleotide-binding universal stress UspA family protein
MLPIRTVLHPTDFSDQSDLAFRLACSLAHDYGARLILLHVAEPPVAAYEMGILIPPPTIDLDLLRRKLQKMHSRDPKTSVEYRLEQGDAATEILRVADEINSDVIVLGTHGRTGLGRLLMGSVAEQVLRRAHCPVVTAKGLRPQEEAALATRDNPAQASAH